MKCICILLCFSLLVLVSVIRLKKKELLSDTNPISSNRSPRKAGIETEEDKSSVMIVVD